MTRSNQHGWSLMELLIVIMIISLTTTLGTFSIGAFVRSNNTLAFANQLRDFLYYAKADAVNYHEQVLVCEVTKNSRKRWHTVRGDNCKSPKKGETLHTIDVPQGLSLSSNTKGFSVQEDGFIEPDSGANNATFTICQQKDARNGFQMTYFRTGRIKMGERGMTPEEDGHVTALTNCQ